MVPVGRIDFRSGHTLFFIGVSWSHFSLDRSILPFFDAVVLSIPKIMLIKNNISKEANQIKSTTTNTRQKIIQTTTTPTRQNEVH